MKYLFIIIVLSLFNHHHKVDGIYHGQSISSHTFDMKKNGSLKNEKINYNKHVIKINTDSTFNYEFEKNTSSSSISSIKKRICSGKWNLKNDTIILNSKYKGMDFFTVKEKYNPDLPEKTYQISIKNQDDVYTWGTSANIWVNNLQIEKCENNDTVYTKCDQIESIKLNIMSINLEYDFEPTQKKNNQFDILFHTTLDNENFYLENWKLLIDHKKLLPIKETNEVVDGFKKD